MNLNKEDWVRLGQWVQPTLSACFWNNWCQDNNFPFEIGKLDGRILMIHGHTYIWKKDFDVLENFLNDNQGDYELLDTIEKWINEVKDGLVFDTKISVDFIEQLKENMNNIVNPWMFCLLLGDKAEEILKKNFVVKPIRKTLVERQIQEANALHIKLKKLNICLDEVEKYPKLATEIMDHVKKYESIGLHHFVGNPYTIEKFFNHTITESHKDDYIEWLTKLLSILAYGRGLMAETSGIIQLKSRQELYKIDEKLGLNKGDHIWLSVDELNNALISGHIPYYHDRKDMLSIIDNKIYGKEETKKLIDGIIDKIDDNIQELKGITVSKGIVQGKVRIIVTPIDVQKIQEGDILVAPETTPAFFPAMRIASGIITERGGITSHAAIVSRELGKPCVIAIENATRILKDGQKIELDANNGFVRII